MRYQLVSDLPPPISEDLAFLYHHDGFPVRFHFLCYRVGDEPGRYVIVRTASEGTDFYDYRGASPEDRNLPCYSVYRVEDSDQIGGYDQFHYLFCFADKSIEIVGQSFGCSAPIEGFSAASVLLQELKRNGYF